MTFDKQKLPAHSKDHSPAGISHRNVTNRHRLSNFMVIPVWNLLDVSHHCAKIFIHHNNRIFSTLNGMVRFEAHFDCVHGSVFIECGLCVNDIYLASFDLQQ